MFKGDKILSCNRIKTQQQINDFNKLLCKYSGKKDCIMPVLQKTQEIFGYIQKECVTQISKCLKISENEIYGIITFYSQFTLTPKAKYNIDVCLGTACFVLGANEILEKILSKLGVRVGEITKDGKWIVTSCRCLGCCGLAPAITINGEVFGKLKVQDIDKILDSFGD